VRRRAWAGARPLGGALVLALVVWRVGPDPFLDGVRGLGPGTLLAGLAVGAVVTVCSAWRWRVVAAGLGIGLPLSGATAAYYRSQFLNSALPGGVVGDVDRGLRSGVDAGSAGRGLRAVVWERATGQVVQAAIAVAVLLTFPSPVRAAVPGAIALTAATVAVLLVTCRALARRGPVRVAEALRSAATEAGAVLLHRAALRPVLLSSLVVVGGHLGMFWLAAHATGVDVPPQRLLPLALVVLLAAGIPFNVGGWGPREGAAAWVFAAAGEGAGAGAAVATAFGVLTLVAVLPGAAVLLAGRRRVRARAVRPAEVRPEPLAVVHGGTQEDGAIHG
jgi:glycosyltransferase 2 family protein